jgi:hypothetical protein
VITGEKITINTIYFPDSKIEGPIPFTFDGPGRLATFTVQCWTLQTAFHVFSSAIGLLWLQSEGSLEVFFFLICR